MKKSSFDKLYEYIHGDDECQYSVHELLSKLREFSVDRGDFYSYTQMKDLPKKKYCEIVNIIEGRGKGTFLAFKDGSKKILHQTWFKKREKTSLRERKRIVLTAARIIREDILNWKSVEGFMFCYT
ncbi:hypothetical protein AVEN_171913-1 [Araneus ventricosus]|uniref:Uncharacterized protein n=1 Tax=Araneus ventricosus TaxID=182803 RepID=A0A4Y2RBF6_ARAVE|nr:hypothetical protein AVEN_171913-1 [Araneus ventricosus]